MVEATPAQSNAPAPRDPAVQFQTLPGPLRTFLIAPERRKALQNIYKQHGIAGSMLDSVVDLVGEISFGERPIGDLLPGLVKLGLSEEKAKKLAADVAGFGYLPVASLMKTDVWHTIESWGGDPKKYPTVTVEARKVTADTLFEEVLRESRLALAPRMENRVRHFLDSRMRGVRDDVELKTMLTRADKVGGAELAEADADRIVGLLRLKLAGAQIVEEGTIPPPEVKPPSPPSPRPPTPPPSRTPVAPPKDRPTLEEALPAAQRFLGPQKPAAVTGTGVPKKKSALTVRLEDEAEIATIKKAVEERLPALTKSYDQALAASVESVVRGSKLKLATPELQSRLRNVVGARLRDLRDAAETEALVVLPIGESGLGLTKSQAESLGNLLEAEHLALQGQMGAEKLKEKHTFVSAQEAARESASESKERAEREALDRRYLETVKKSRVIKEKGVILPPSSLTAPRLPTAAPTPTPKLSPASVPPAPGGKLKIEDVKFARTVAGPAEELRAMSLVEFRRLSKDPKEATLKIRDRIELLKAETFEHYVRGVRGWQASEPSRLYLDLTRTALETGKPVTELIASRTSANQPTLTLEEFQAILALNGQLRF